MVSSCQIQLIGAMEDAFESRVKQIESKNADVIFSIKNEAENKVFILDKKAKEDKRILENKISVLSKNLSESN